MMRPGSNSLTLYIKQSRWKIRDIHIFTFFKKGLQLKSMLFTKIKSNFEHMSRMNTVEISTGCTVEEGETLYVFFDNKTGLG